MNTLPTPEEYRKKRLESHEKIREVITKNYAAFWEVAQTLHELGDGGTRIETPFGDFTIIPFASIKEKNL